MYDITAWVPIHPGGKTILAGAGTDASALFRSAHGDDVPEAAAYLGSAQVPEVGPLAA